MIVPMGTIDTQSDSHDQAPLTAKLRVEPSNASTCTILGSGDNGDAIIRNSILEDPSGQSGECRAIVSCGDETSSWEYVRGRICATCVCPVFQMNDCIADIECFSDERFFVSVTIPDRTTLREVISDLRSRNATVSLEQILSLEQSEANNRTVELNANKVTEKQREAIDAAVEAGYYDRPRGTNLGELAERLGVSESAVSQRLNGAESTLIRELASTNGSRAEL